MNRFIITEISQKTVAALWNGKKILDLGVFSKEDGDYLQVGDIWIGRIQRAVPRLHAFFVDLFPGCVGYLSEEEAEHLIYVNKKATSPRPCQGDEILVQVKREAMKSKVAGLTGRITLTGNTLVFSNYGISGETIGISSKIKEEEERKRLHEILASLLNKTEEGSWIVRTNGAGREAEEFQEEKDRLYQNYLSLRQKASVGTPGTLLFRKGRPWEKFLEQISGNELEEIITDQEETYSYLLEVAGAKEKEKLRFYKEEVSLDRLYGISKTLEKACERKVWLPSGGFLVIEQTEALTVIDVNTGKAGEGRGDSETFFLKINLEAAKEAAGEIRLRNISGIILIDFIDLPEQKEQELYTFLRQELAKDPIQTQLVDITALGLAELTRKKQYASLAEQWGSWKRI